MGNTVTAVLMALIFISGGGKGDGNEANISGKFLRNRTAARSRGCIFMTEPFRGWVHKGGGTKTVVTKVLNTLIQTNAPAVAARKNGWTGIASDLLIPGYGSGRR